MFSKFSEEAQKVLLNAKLEMSDLKHPYIGSEHLLLAILKDNSFVSKLLKGYGIKYNDIRSEIIKVIGIGERENHWYLYTPLLKRVIENAVIISKEDNVNEVSVIHLLLSLIEEGDGVAIRILNNLDVDIDDIYDDLSSSNCPKKGKKKLQIDEFGYDLNKRVLEGKIDPVIERNDEVNRLIEILCRKSKNNPLLIGEAGVGKTAIVEELANRIVKGDVPNCLKDKRIISVEMASLIAGTKYRGEFEDRISKLINEIEENKDIIVFIDEVHTIIGAGGAEGAIDASNILKPALSRGRIRVIGATTIDEYKKTIEKDKAFDRRFQKLDIKEPDNEKTYKILVGLREIYQNYHNVMISDEVLKQIIFLSNKYIYNRYQPDKAIDILDEVCVRCSLMNTKLENKYKEYNKNLVDILNNKKTAIREKNYEDAFSLKREEQIVKNKLSKMDNGNSKKRNVVTLEMVRDVVSNKTGILIYDFDNCYNVSGLEKNLRKTVIGQDKAIKMMVEQSKRIKAGFKTSNRPLSFLFLGPTGVGKTLLVKEYAKNLFGENKLIRFDMSEYKDSHSISKLIGSPSGYVGYNDNCNGFEKIRNNPCSIILLDEIEKASYDVINLFLQILDEGKIVDNSGREIRFDNTIIIMTSNIGYGKNSIGFTEDTSSSTSKLKEFFNIEFINRIDNVVMFDKLKEDDIRIIVNKKIKDIKNKVKEKGMNISISKKVVDDLVMDCNYDEFGARQIDKLIDNRLESLIINEMIMGNDKIVIKSLIT